METKDYISRRRGSSGSSAPWGWLICWYLFALITTFGLVLLLDEVRYQRAQDEAAEAIEQIQKDFKLPRFPQ